MENFRVKGRVNEEADGPMQLPLLQLHHRAVATRARQFCMQHLKVTFYETGCGL
jgi:hypothetical protein